MRGDNFLTSSLFRLGLATFFVTILSQGRLAVSNDKPILRTNLDGPANLISDLAFSSDGRMLFAASWDKRVHVWVKQFGVFVYEPGLSFRVPIHGGLDGAITAIALSDDGKLLAVGGRGARLDTSGVRDEGYIWPGDALTANQRLAEGLIYVFDTKTREATVLKGHAGTISALQFATVTQESQPALVSMAEVEVEETFIPEVRVWDVGTQETLHVSQEIAKLAGNAVTALHNSVPQLTVKGSGRSDVEIGISFPFQRSVGFVVWNPGQNRWSQLDPNGDVIPLSASVTSNQGWQVGAVNRLNGQGIVGVVPSAKTTNLKLSPEVTSNDRRLPYAIGATHNGTVRVSLSGQYGESSPQYNLLAWREGQTNPTETPLWNGHPKNPMLAVSSAGDVATVDPTGMAIQVANVTQDGKITLVRKKLQANRIEISQVQFVANGEIPGLQIQSNRREQILFNISESEIEDDVSGWRSNSFDDQYDLAFDQQKAEIILSRSGRESRVPICNFSDRPVSIVATGTTQSLLAVAWNEGAEPRFDLYDIASGELRRRMRGVESNITSLDISQDQRFLVAATAAGSIHLFSLKDARETEHGLLRQGNQILSLKSDNESAVVSEDFGEIRQGEVLTGIQLAGETINTGSAVDFYEMIHELPPGESIMVQTNRRQVLLTVGNAIEEKKPTFSILLSRAEMDPDSIEWVGWHPIGVFESGSREAEHSLGWHFNTGEATSPTNFAEISEYRDRFYRTGLLDSLYRTESIPPRAADPPAQLSLQLFAPDGRPLSADSSGEYFLREPTIKAVLKIHEPFPEDAIGEVRCELELGEMLASAQQDQSGPREWTFQFATNDWTSAQGLIKASVISAEYSPRVFRQSVPIRYQPEAPQIAVADLPIETDQRRQQIVVDLQTSEWAETRLGVIRVDAQGNRQTIYNKTVERGRVTIDADLREGMNRFEITAENGSPLEDYEEFETVSLVRTIQYQKPISTSPPIIKLEELISLGTSFDLTRLAGELKVHSPELTITGSVNSEANLKELVISNGDDSVVPNNFTGEETKRFVIRENVALKPGRNEISVRSATIADAESKAPLIVFFEPIPSKPTINSLSAIALPDVELSRAVPSIQTANETLVLNEQLHRQQTLVNIRKSASTDGPFFPEELEFVVDGKTVQPTSIDEKNSLVTAVVPIMPGTQRLQAAYKNEWGGRQTSDPISIEFRRPPKIADVTISETVDQPFLRTLTATIISPDELPLKSYGLTVAVNDTPARGADIQLRQLETGEWLATISNVSLKPDSRNQLSLTVANEDGATLSPWKQLVVTPPERLPPPTIVLISPELETQTDQEDLEIRFRVETESTIQTVSVLNDRYRRQADTEYDEESRIYTAKMPLDEKTNLIRLAAVDKDGQAADPIRLTVNRIRRPTSIRIDSIGEFEYSEATGSGEKLFAFETSTTRVNGHVRSGRLGDRPMFVRVWLNDFLQDVVPLKKSAIEKSRWDFSAGITMNRENNSLHLELVGGPVDASSDRRVSLTCQSPATQQTLHIVLLSPNQQDAGFDSLLDRMRESLAIECDGDECSSPSFSVIREYPVIGPNLQVQLLGGVFSKIQGEIITRAGNTNLNEAAMNDVILVFYAGQEYRFEDQSRFVLATGGRSEVVQGSDEERIRQEMDQLITSEFLVDWMQQLRGAHLLFLDVESNVAKQPNRDVTDPHLGVYRVTSGTKTAIESSPLLKALSQITPRTRYLGEVDEQLSPITTSAYTPPGLSQMEFGGRQSP